MASLLTQFVSSLDPSYNACNRDTYGAAYNAQYGDYETARNAIAGDVGACHDYFNSRSNCGKQIISGDDLTTVTDCKNANDPSYGQISLFNDLWDAGTGTLKKGAAYFYSYTVYAFLMYHIVLMVFSTSAEIFAIQTSYQTRLMVIVLSILQLVWAVFTVSKMKLTDISVPLWVGLLYFGLAALGGIASIVLTNIKRNARGPTEPQVWDFLGMSLKGVQTITAIIFGIMFLVLKTDASYKLKMYAVVVITAVEIIVQALSFIGFL